jgi:hypothetical protein
MSDNGIKLPAYTPMESLGHELGIMFGFLAACIGTVGLYFVIWQGKKTPPPPPPFFFIYKKNEPHQLMVFIFFWGFASHPTPRR